MASPDQVGTMIRYGLSLLRSRNAQHEFETLCRHLARRRICSNILPATGPVAAGGDQGRDFETFRTYLRDQQGLSSFLALTDERTIAFSCTLQQEGISSKIKGDVRSIMSQGTAVDVIYALCEVNIPVAERHRIIGDISDTFGVELFILDGAGIAELLADPEIFWIAQRYLDLPSEILPDIPVDEREPWYRSALDKWHKLAEPAPTYGMLSELTHGIRYASTNPNLASDIQFWIDKLVAFEAVAGASSGLGRSASYEILVASLRRLETLEGCRERIESYFADISELSSAGALEDAQVLLMYLVGWGFKQGLLEIEAQQAMDWRDKLIERTESLLSEGPSIERRCLLLQTLGLLHMTPVITNPDEPMPESRIGAALEVWSEMLQLVSSAFLFPVDSFADVVSHATVVLARHSKYRSFTQCLDTLVGERSGRSAAAARCRDRAMHLYKAEQFTAALREFHDARRDWFAGDTVRGALLSSMLIARCYNALHLHMAAKYYYLSVGVLALDLNNSDLHDMAAVGLLSAAYADYSQGAWFSFLELAELGLKAHYAYDRDVLDFEEHGILESTLFSLMWCSVIANRLGSSAHEIVERAINTSARLGFGDEIKELAASQRDESDEDLASSIEKQLGFPAFSDAGSERSVSWRALGVMWTVSFENDYDSVRAAERFVAITQILLADLAGTDLCLLPTNVRIELSLTSTSLTAENNSSNSGRSWKVVSAPYSAGDIAAVQQTQTDTLAVVMTILLEISVLPEEQLVQIMERVFSAGLLDKITPAKVYDAFYRDCVPPERFTQSGREHYVPFASGTAINIPEHAEMAWSSGPGPGYSKELAHEYLKNRYEGYAAMIRRTRNILAADSAFTTIVARLRSEGWLDWQIMSAVFSVVHSYRVSISGGARSQEEYRHQIERWFGEEQNDWPLAPARVFSYEAIRAVLPVGFVSSLEVWGLRCRQQTPDLSAIKQLLDERYGYSTDDIAHPDPFGPQSGNDERSLEPRDDSKT